MLKSALIQDLSPSTPRLPKLANTVYELLVDVGINVDEWAVTVDGEPVENPRNNISRNTSWSYGGEGGEPFVLCIWHDLISWTSTPPEFAYNEYKYQLDIANERAITKDVSKKARLTRWHRRSGDFFQAVRRAHISGTPIRIILLAGKRVDHRDSMDEQGGVKARELDPVQWFAHECDTTSGEYRLVRGKAPTRTTSPAINESADPLNSPDLFALLATLDETEALALVKARTRQSQFRKSLFERWKGCSVSGCSLPDVLIASHIKPWSLCETYEERVGVANGLLLTPNLDKLFDAGLIAFEDNLRIRISPLLPAGWCSQLGIDPGMRLRHRYEDILPFLAWHRQHRYFETKEQREAKYKSGSI